MKNILIYKQEGNLHITHFVDSLDVEGVHEQAQKMLPFGVLYRVGTTEELPQDRVFRAAWDIEESDLNDGIGGETNAKQLLSNSKQLLSSRQEQLESFENNLKALETELEELSAEHASLNNLATEKEKVWADTKDSAFAAKSDWKEKKLAAENAEKIVADKGEEASEEEKQSAVDLRKISKNAFKAQDKLFNNKTEAANARLESDQFVEKLNNQNNKINQVKFSIVDANSLVAESQAAVSTHQQKLLQLFNKLPPESRRGHVVAETEEVTDDKN
jgi:chromosome segregation ATPase